MTGHYYSKTPDVQSDPKHWDYTLKGSVFRFKTDNGVFSKGDVDFGSRLLIETFDKSEEIGDGTIVDVGCGYGPIGLAMAKYLPDRTVHMVDVNERAIALAKENAERNQITNVQIYESDGLENVKAEQVAYILTNPPIRAGKDVVHKIYEQSYHLLIDGGELWVVIQKKQGAPSSIDKLTTLFSEVETVDKKKGYFIIRAKK
ncbi:class I SAM-dependent methyltransferase [Cytobacillus spongiae]|uniref:class I SAM-dependent methyltransferase n=1 Tax=Cytobacillus spongiae TaxID=2901381 RepID=UPI001F26DA5B|nr:class I SAM-dependent methyltransferase [Cytobacillus spongiae]UII56065.1 class I SAM-dependent methyltransferase [Cytobacillus spongiae]